MGFLDDDGECVLVGHEGELGALVALLKHHVGSGLKSVSKRWF